MIEAFLARIVHANRIAKRVSRQEFNNFSSTWVENFRYTSYSYGKNIKATDVSGQLNNTQLSKFDL